MRFRHPTAGIQGLFALMIVASVALVGCGEQNLTGPDESPSSGEFLVASDPLTGVLNSTDGSTPVDAQSRIDRLAEVLGLDEDQKAAFAAAYDAFKTGIGELRAKLAAGEVTREQAREQVGALRETFEAEIQVILTDEQWNQLQEMREKRDGRRPGHRDPADRWNAWLQEIGASEDQVAAVMAALQTLHEGIRALHNQVRSGDLPIEEAKEQAMGLRDAFHETLQDTLTEDQYAALLELLPDRPERDG